jgi:hypothetical protein
MAASVVTSCHTFAVPTKCGTRSGPLLRDDMQPVTSCPVKTSETWTPRTGTRCSAQWMTLTPPSI